MISSTILPPNPHYLVTEEREPELKPTISDDGRRYYMWNLPVTRGENFDLQTTESYNILDSHLSVDETYDPKRHYLSTIHLTIHLESKDKSKTFTAHVFLGFDGSILDWDAYENDDKKTKLPKSTLNKTALKNFLVLNATTKLNELIQHLSDKHKTLDRVRDDLVNTLDLQSMQPHGIKNETYQSQLITTLSIFNDHEKFYFTPDARKNLLQNFLIIKNNDEKKVEAPKSDAVEPDPTSTATALEPPLTSVYTRKANLTANNDTEIKESDLFNFILQFKKNRLEAKITSDLNQAPEISRELDNLKNEYEIVIIIQCCIDGNLAVLKQYFDRTSLKTLPIPVLLTLLPTCIYHQHPDVFKYIFGLAPPAIQYKYISPHLTRTQKFSSDAKSCLDIAYLRDDYNSFFALINEFNFNPINSSFNYQNEVTVNESKKRYLQALNGKNFSPIENIFSKEDMRGDLTPLHNAVISQNEQKVADLLSDKSVNIEAQCPDGYTPFAYAVARYSITSSPFVFNERILSEFLAHGQKIEAPIGPCGNTALFFACMENHIELAEFLLKNGAQLFSKNVITALNQDGSKITIENATPFFISFYLDHKELYLRLLQKDISDNIPEAAFFETIKKLHDLKVLVPIQLYLKGVYKIHKNGRHLEAIEIYSEILKVLNAGYYQEYQKANIDVEHQLHYSIALCYIKTKQFKEAIESLNSCISIIQNLPSQLRVTDSKINFEERARTELTKAQKLLDETNKSSIIQHIQKLEARIGKK